VELYIDADESIEKDNPTAVLSLIGRYRYSFMRRGAIHGLTTV
jgi:hypothetical protein